MIGKHGETSQEYLIPTMDQIARDVYDEARIQAALAETFYDLRDIPPGMALAILAVEYVGQDPNHADEFLFMREGRHAEHEWLQYTDHGLMPVQMLGSSLLDGVVFEPNTLKAGMSFCFKTPELIVVEGGIYTTMAIRQTGPVVDYRLRMTSELPLTVDGVAES